MANTPKNLKYSKEHEWLIVQGDVATLGVTDHAQSELGDITFIELPEVGRKVEAGEDVAGIESVKAFSEVFSPVAGQVVEINETLSDKPETVNADPYGAGWIVKMKITDATGLKNLMTSDEYDAYLAEEE
jgi:glycine cleavage system H protein